MGLGKTLQVIALIVTNQLPSDTLIVLPLALLDMWTDALSESVTPPLQILSYHGDERRDLTLERLSAYDVVLILR